jgi:hypothetical protein
MRSKEMLREVVHSLELSLVLLWHEPEMEVGCSLHQGHEVEALDSCWSFDLRNEPMENRTELGAFGWVDFTEIQLMRPGLDDDGACAS